MLSEEDLREHDQFISTLSEPELKFHTYQCGLCKEEAWHKAGMTAFDLGFPEFTDGSSGQQGYANVLRLKFHTKHGDSVLPIIKVHTDPKWWLDNRSTLQTGTMKSKIGDLIRKAELYLESPIKAEIDRLQDVLVGMQKKHKQELKSFEIRRQMMQMDEARLEAAIADLQETVDSAALEPPPVEGSHGPDWTP